MQDPNKCNVDVSVERISRGVYGVSGDIVINVDIPENDDTMVAMIFKFYRQQLQKLFLVRCIGLF